MPLSATARPPMSSVKALAAEDGSISGAMGVEDAVKSPGVTVQSLPTRVKVKSGLLTGSEVVSVPEYVTLSNVTDASYDVRRR